MKGLGINCMNHDAAMAVVDYSSGIGKILFAAHAERYSKVKNDHFLNKAIVDEAYKFGPFNKIVYYEKPLLKKTRQLYAGQYGLGLSYTEMPQWHLDHFNIKIDEYVKHHESHAAAGYFTSPFRDATILTVDAIGEWDTVSISTATKIRIENKETIKYPHSLGILYSAFTQRCGLKPAEEEYILMGMAAYGKPIYKDHIYEDFVQQSPFKLKKNLHRGLSDWHPEADIMDIAASIQAVLEECLASLWHKASKYGSRNLVYAGGVALNCAANRALANLGLFDNIWIIPNPGDA